MVIKADSPTERTTGNGDAGSVSVPPAAEPLDAATLGTVLAFAPHPADETLGCGGLIATLAMLNVRVDVAVVTDGSLAPERSGTQVGDSSEPLHRQQTGSAIGCLGVASGHIHYLAYDEGELPLSTEPGFAELVARFKVLIELIKPETLLVPLRTETTRDYRSVHAAARAAIEFPAQRLRILEYPALNVREMPPTDAVDDAQIWRLQLDDSAVQKAAAMATFREQRNGMVKDREAQIAVPTDLASTAQLAHELFMEFGPKRSRV